MSKDNKGKKITRTIITVLIFIVVIALFIALAGLAVWGAIFYAETRCPIVVCVGVIIFYFLSRWAWDK